MTSSKKIKIWTIILHGFILVGFGHGILFFILIEILWFPYLSKQSFSFLPGSTFESNLPAVGLLTMLGQIALIISILTKTGSRKKPFHIAGLGLLWLSILYFNYSNDKDDYIYFSTLTCIPFAICTMMPFFDKPVKKLYNRVRDNY